VCLCVLDPLVLRCRLQELQTQQQQQQQQHLGICDDAGGSAASSGSLGSADEVPGLGPHAQQLQQQQQRGLAGAQPSGADEAEVSCRPAVSQLPGWTAAALLAVLTPGANILLASDAPY
jgi:hypothetical protein